MNVHNCILLTDNREKITFWDPFFAAEKAQFPLAFSSGMDEDPEELCLLYYPDIVILDYEKDYGDIVAIANRFLACSSDVRVVIFTDYTQFSFEPSFVHMARTRILPRPVSYAALQDCVTQIADELRAIRERVFSPKALSGLLNDNIPVIRQHYLSMLLRQPVPKTENVLQKFKALQIDCPGPYYAAFVAEIVTPEFTENFEAINFLLRTNIKSAIEARGHHCYIFFDSDFRINCLVCSTVTWIAEEVEVVLSDVKDHFEKMSGLRLVVGIGRTVDLVTKVNMSYKDAETAHKLAADSEGIVLFNKISTDKKREILSDYNIDRILQLYSSNKIKEYQREIAQCMEKVKADEDLQALKCFVVKYIVRAINSSEQWRTKVLDYPLVPYILSRVYAATDSQTIEVCEKEFTSLLISIGQNYQSQEIRLIEQAVSYINENLANPSLDLEMVSSRIGISKSYFCRLFHRISNQKFSNFLRIQRVEKAKALLKQADLKTYEVADMTGFTSPKYFSSVFKQMTGVTPSEYQKNGETGKSE